MTNSLAHQGEVTSSASLSACLRRSRVDAIAGDSSFDTETKQSDEIPPDTSSSLPNRITPTKTATLDSDSDVVSDKGTLYPATSLVSSTRLSGSAENDSGDGIYAEHVGLCVKTMPGQEIVDDIDKRNHDNMEVSVDSSNGGKPLCCLSALKGSSCASHDCCDARDNDAGHELRSTSNSALSSTCGSRQTTTRISSDLIDESTEDIACNNVSGTRCQQDPCSFVLLNASSENVGGNIGMVTIAEYPVAPMEPDVAAACERGDLVSTVLQVAPERIPIVPEASGVSSSDASIMHSDDENVKVCEKGCEVVFRDLEAGLPLDVTPSVDEEGMHSVDLTDDQKCSSHVEATKTKDDAVPVDDYDPAASCDVKDLVDSELRVPLLEHVQTDDPKSSQDKEVSPVGEKKLSGDSLEKEPEVHGLRKRRGAKTDSIKPSAAAGDVAGTVKMPEEQKKGVASTRTKDASADIGLEAKQKPVDKKSGKQGKAAAKPSSAARKVGDPQPLEELRAKEEAETNRKVHESLDNFIRQTIRCEPYMNFTSRPGDKPLQRLRSDVFENHVAGKFARGFKVENGSDPRDIPTEENRGVDSYSNDVDGLKDGSAGSAKGITGLGRGAQHSLKVPPGVVAFTQAAAKGTDLQGWFSPSKTKCEKCTREFCSTLNYRRHVRVHRRSLNPEKEDLSKERSKVAAFWDRLSPEDAGSIVHYDNMDIEDLSGQSAFDALKVFINQPGLPSLPQGIFKAGAWLLDIVQNKSSVPLSSERLLAILDDASEKTFLCGGTSAAVQRFVFNNEAGKIGLEEKNLVASMGFHIELKLVKAWMADKEAEALRCQQALFKEEEAAQQKRKKLLEKKRLKKIRQKERKGSTPQLILQELENESIDDEGNAQGIGEEDDSPTGTGSSSSSLASALDLALPESAELDEMNGLAAPSDLIDDQDPVLGEKPESVKNKSSDEEQLHRFRDGIPQYGDRERQQGGSHNRGDDMYRKDDPSGIEAGSSSHLRPSADQVDWDGDFDTRSPHPSYRSRSGGIAGEAQSNLYYRKGEQDRIAQDFKRRPDFERYPQERRPVRIARDNRPRSDYSDQKPLRDSRGFERYGDSHQTAFKALRKPTAYFMKSDSGNADLPSISRMPQYRSKPLGMNSRAPSTAGNGQVIWTRKVPQPAAAADATTTNKDTQEETIHEDAENSCNVDGWEAASEASPEVAEVVLRVPDFAGGDMVATRLEDEEMEKKENAAATSVPLDGNCKLAGSGDDVILTEERMPEEEDESLSGALLVGSLSVPLGKFATVSGSQARSGSTTSHIQHHRDDSEIENVSGRNDLSRDPLSFQEAGVAPHNHHSPPATGSSSDGSELLRASMSTFTPATTQPSISKPHSSSTSPERGENSQQNAAAALPLGYERLVVKTGGSWQTSAGRYVPAKVWRAVGMVGERQDASGPGLAASGDGAASNFMEARLSEDLDVLGRSDGEREPSPKADDGRQGNPALEKEFLRDDFEEGRHLSDDGGPVVMKTSDYQSTLSASSAPFRPAARSASGHLLEGKSDHVSKVESDDGVESSPPAVGLSFSVYVEVAESFFNERWRAALAHASVDEVLHVSSDRFSYEGEGLNFLEMVSWQMSKENSRQNPGAESGQSPSTVATEPSGKPAHQGAFLSKIFNDSDQTGVQDIRCISTIDEEGLDGASPRAHSSEDDAAGLRDASTSPFGSEHYMSGSEMASSGPLATGESFPESSGGGGAVGSSYSRRGNSRHERWHRNSRDRFSEQRYMARRQGLPVERNC